MDTILVTLLLTILGSVLTAVSFAIGRKDKATKDSSDVSYKMGVINTQIKQILDKLDKIDNKLDGYDKEIDEKIETALQHHIKEYHKEV